MKKRNTNAEWFFVLFLIITFLCYCWSLAERFPNYDAQEERRLREYVDTNNTYAISYQRSIRNGTLSEIDATDEYLYLEYSGSKCVDVYTLGGEFLYAILLPNEKGGEYIKCVDNLVYIHDSLNTVYVFEGTTLISKYKPEDAKLLGYDASWFQEKQSFQRIEGSKFLKYDAHGKCILNCDIPQNTYIFNPLRATIFLTSLIGLIIALFREKKH